MLSAESIFEYDWQLALGDEPLSEDEFERLATLKVPLVQVRGQWVELRPDQIRQAIKFWEKREAAAKSRCRKRCGCHWPAKPLAGAAALPINAVAVEGWLNDLMQQLAGGAKMQPVPAPADFHGALRPYQSAGLAWLAFLRQWGLGACLADDMGLGKTIQVIALLLHERSAGRSRKPALLICPTSVVGNWQRELARFAPDLRVLIHHGAARQKDDPGQAGRAARRGDQFLRAAAPRRKTSGRHRVERRDSGRSAEHQEPLHQAGAGGAQA